ncbi:piggyBac transposable element-derived protein 4-like [Entelurus aequoreus]|uniref:piggyBac transposable element-derived protein 4-like n=1 Tax=Entelurus aequoreus TaxID=161455 RepID=UPI002B1E3851|nr:piggyBac transposable element-derived protein 4-like [Entelurus aequoreus]XP_061881084.1 piggyBac transposable element-derived protein 4-like [Entelurus aequoreus]XP_061887245.1 piggyBac transposable element-derived protein 4-like [Entelurus aequoreus]XP_061890142.1 piggyBac transposable element-derived protein 4-like [Entelurus aequoreus]XP_061895792.1 piggyBac transposable element-derived protein 4-like [Entelurus aequoreus]XP_061897012.1 piggyBac transposable element-derived protein 4-li
MMPNHKTFSVQEVLDQVFSEEVDIEENVSEIEDNVVEDPDYGASSSDEDETLDAEVPVNTGTPADIFLSKNGKLSWSPAPRQRQGRLSAGNVIKMVPGPTRYAISRVQDIKSAFELLMTPSIENHVLLMTNLEGSRVFGDSWKPIDAIDLQAYIGLLILGGVYKSKGEAAESLWNKETGRAIFPATMSLKKFHIMSRVLRFDDREKRQGRREHDKLAAIRDVWDKWVQQLPLLYNPGPHVTVDECLVAFRGRCPFRQYIPSKPAKYGIKIWAACDAQSSYAWNMQVYTGKAPGEAPEKNQGMRVVLDMAEGLEGHNITCDNFFTSYALGEELAKRKVTMLGTVRKNKPELPSELVAIKNRQATSSVFAFTENATAVSYCPKKGKNVVLMSTMHKDAQLSTREDKKPQMVLDYNATKGGVDNLDKVTGTYSCRRMTARWPLVVFFNIIDVSAYNAFVLWREISEGWNSEKLYRRRLFLEQLGYALVQPQIARRVVLPRASAAAVVIVEDVQREAHTSNPPVARGQKRGRCQICSTRNDNKTTNTCGGCGKYICKEHIRCGSCAQ